MSLSFKESLNQSNSGDFTGDGGNWQKHPNYECSDIYSDRGISTISSKKNISLNSRQFNITQEENSQYIPFEMPRFYDGLDLVNATISIHYETSSERHGAAQPINVVYNDKKIRFGWLIDSNVTIDPGKLKFEIHAYGIAYGENGEAQAYVWKSKTNEKLNVLESLCESDEVITQIDDSWVQELVTDVAEQVAETLKNIALNEQVQAAIGTVTQYADDLNDVTNKKIESIENLIDGILNEIENFSADTVQYVEQELTDAQMAQARKNINANGFDWHALGEHNGYAANMGNYNSITDWDRLLAVPSSTNSSAPAFGELLTAASILLTGYDKSASKENALKEFNAAISDLSNAGISPSGYRIVHTLDVENTNKYLFVVMQYNASNNRWILTDQTGDVARFVAVTGDEIIDDTTLIYPDTTLSIDGRAADAKAVGQALDLKAELEHNHKISNIDGLQGVLDNKASLLHDHDSDYDTKGAAAAALEAAKYHANDVAGAVRDDLLNGAGPAYDTLKELGELIDSNQNTLDALHTVALGKADAEHIHTITDITGLKNILDDAADVYETKLDASTKLQTAQEYTDNAVGDAIANHTHDDKYYTEAEVDALIESASNSEVFAIRVTKGEDNKYSADKTFDEIYDAYINNREIFVKYNDGSYDAVYPLNFYNSTSAITAFVFEYHSVINTRVFRRKFTISNSNFVSFNEVEFSQDRIATVNTNSTLTTTNKTLVGAINEMNEKVHQESEAIPAPATATVGQTIAVKAIDENGKPTEWEAVDFTGGGGADGGSSEWELINTVTVTEDMGVDHIEITTDSNGNPFELLELAVIAQNVTHRGGYAYASVTINGKGIGECRKKPNVFIHIRKKADIWIAEYCGWGYEQTSPTTYGFGHTSMIHRTTEIPTINKFEITYSAGELEIWGLRK